MFSPSAYERHLESKTSEGGLFGRLMDARNSVAAEKDAEVATQLEQKLKLEAERRELEEEKASEALARRLHTEERDEALAMKMEMEEKQQADDAAKKATAIALKDAEAARKIAAEEKEAAEKEAAQHKADMEFARKMQTDEVGDIKAELEKLTTIWKKPAIEVVNVEGGIVITSTLPHMGKLNVHVDEETKVILVKAAPDFSAFTERLKVLPEDMQLDPLKITLDLKIVGKETVSQDEVETSYDKATGQCKVFVKNAFVRKEEKASFVGRITSGFKRMLSSRSLGASSRSLRK